MATVHEETGSTSIMCVDASNLVPALKNVKNKYPDSNFKICADNDKNGKGLTEAKKAIALVNGKIVMPDIEGHDFNDLRNAKGSEAVKKQLGKFLSDDDLNKKTQKAYEDHIDYLNKYHAVIMLGGKCCILNEGTDPVFNRPNVTFSSVQDFKNRYLNKQIPNPSAHLRGQSNMIGIASLWMKSADRREYESIVFAPGDDVEGSYNLWRGFAVKPEKGDWSLFQKHIFENISNDKQNINDWLMTWMARIVQDPGGKRPGTAPVFRGGQGVGKGIFLSNFGWLFGNHYLQINNQKQLISQFNSHLKDVLFLFVDEGLWAGDKISEGILKGLITEDTLPIEGKGRDIFLIKNHINLAIASNNEWVVPSGLDERRFFTIDVSEKMKQNHAYFKAIIDQLDNGGYEAMLYDLLEYDISKVKISEVIGTAASFDQKLATMTPVEKFWFEKLREGTLRNDENIWSQVVPRKELYDQYLTFCDEIKTRYRLSNAQFSKSLRKLCPYIRQRYLTIDIDSGGNQKQAYHYEFPSIEECRFNFEQKIKAEYVWDQDEIFCSEDFEI